MERTLPALTRYVRQPLRKWAIQRRLRGAQHELTQRNDEEAFRLADVLAHLTMARDDERPWLTRIALRRVELAASEEPVAFGVERAGAVDTVGRRSLRVSKPPLWGLFLLRLVRAYGPRRCLELGTAFGISATYQAAGLELEHKGHLITVEGAPEVAALARLTISAVGLSPRVTVETGRFRDVLPSILLKPIGYAFIDGHHDEHATLEYFNLIAGSIEPPCLIVLDDIRWSSGMARAWMEISALSRVRVAADLGEIGVCVLWPHGASLQ
jgi:predicted O-methyltransferase YrrM